MPRQRSEESWLAEANALVHDLHGVWFYKREPHRNKGFSDVTFCYYIYRRGGGFITRRSSASAVCTFLRKQLESNVVKNKVNHALPFGE